MKLTDYVLTPSDIGRAGVGLRSLGTWDLLGVALAVLIVAFFKLVLNQDFEDSLFVGVLLGSLWWRLDPRIPLIGAIGVLILIPILQVLSNSNILWINDPSEGLAVIAYYLLVIGVAGQVRELRHEKGSAEPEEVAPRKEPPKKAPREPIRPARMRDMETIRKLRANREALRRRDW